MNRSKIAEKIKRQMKEFSGILSEGLLKTARRWWKKRSMVYRRNIRLTSAVKINK